MRCSWKSTGRWRRARRRVAVAAGARAGTSTATNSPRTRWRNSLRTSSNQPTFHRLQTQCIIISHRKHRQLLQLEVVCIHYEPLAFIWVILLMIRKHFAQRSYVFRVIRSSQFYYNELVRLLVYETLVLLVSESIL